jgi:hypothetical protein
VKLFLLAALAFSSGLSLWKGKLEIELLSTYGLPDQNLELPLGIKEYDYSNVAFFIKNHVVIGVKRT